MEAIGTLAGGIAHDFNNLLMAIQGSASVLLFGMDSSDPRYQTLKNIEQTVAGGKKLTQQILAYARKGAHLTRPIALNRVVRDTAATVVQTRIDITLSLELAPELPAVCADESQMLQVVLNLMVNAADAMPHGGRLRVVTSPATQGDIHGRCYLPNPGRYVRLTVADSGTGMDPGTCARVFEPFFTTKKLGRGTGLGLASVYGIVKAHKGYIEVESEQGRGSSFHVFLPATDRPAVEPEAPAEAAVRGSGVVMVVDDQESVLKATAAMLEVLGYEAIPVDNGPEALRVFGERKGQIDLVVLDMIMPEMGGAEVFERLKDLRPEVKVLLSSGYSMNARVDEMLARGGKGFVQKPYSIQTLSAKIKSALQG